MGPCAIWMHGNPRIAESGIVQCGAFPDETRELQDSIARCGETGFCVVLAAVDVLRGLSNDFAMERHARCHQYLRFLFARGA